MVWPAVTPASPPWILAAGTLGVGCWLAVCLGSAVRVASERRRLTRASWVTTLRGATAAGLVGAVPVGESVVVAGVVGLAGALDAVDGWLARRTQTTTELGARLDTEADGVLVAVGAVLVVTAELAPPWFLAVGAARPLYAGAVWLRRRRGRTIIDDDSRLPALVYAVAVTAICLGLVPVTTAGLTRPALSVVGVAVLGSFVRSWLVVTGRIGRRGPLTAD